MSLVASSFTVYVELIEMVRAMDDRVSCVGVATLLLIWMEVVITATIVTISSFATVKLIVVGTADIIQWTVM